jgi:hypothetical protein
MFSRFLLVHYRLLSTNNFPAISRMDRVAIIVAYKVIFFE